MKKIIFALTVVLSIQTWAKHNVDCVIQSCTPVEPANPTNPQVQGFCSTYPNITISFSDEYPKAGSGFGSVRAPLKDTFGFYQNGDWVNYQVGDEFDSDNSLFRIFIPRDRSQQATAIYTPVSSSVAFDIIKLSCKDADDQSK